MKKPGFNALSAFFYLVYSSRLSGKFPSEDNNTAIHRVESNWAVVMNIATRMGTLKNIPATPHIMPQNTRFISIASVDRFNVFPVRRGSKMFPNKTCNDTRPMAINSGSRNECAVANENSIGIAHAIMEPIVGI